MSEAGQNQLTQQARDGVRRVPWKTVLAGAGGVSVVTLLAVSGFGPLISAIAMGALTTKEVQDWLANLGANALSGWFADWATGATKEALADPAERKHRATELDQRAATDPAIAAALAKLLEAIDAVPQSLEGLADEVGAQSDLLLEQHSLLKRLSADVQRAGLDSAELRRFVASETASEADRVIKAVVGHTDVQTQAILTELRALRDAQRAVVDLSGANTGDVTFRGDVVGGDQHKPTVTGGIYAAPGSNVTVNQGQTAPSPAFYQLRAPVGDFVGREQEIDQLVQALSKGAAVSICGLRGMGGIGKTELAYVVANRLRAVYPDAQLLIELRGASQNPMSPEQALQTVIRAFEREAKLPDDLSQLQSLYRSTVAGKRALVLADDARDVTQVRPLLPPTGCALLVTSRNRFTLPGMTGLDLGTLSPGEAEALLLEVCPRISEHAAELARLCGYLPLALRVGASLLAASDTRSVGRYLQQLEEERLRLLADPDDPATSVEASLRLSYDALDLMAQTALCQISVFPTSFDLEAARAIIGVEGDVEEILELLRRRSLLEWDAALERYSQHELLRVFAAARLEEADAVRQRHAEHYARIASRAEDDLYLKGAALAGLALFDRERNHIEAGWVWAMIGAGQAPSDHLLIDYSRATAYIGPLRFHAKHERIPKLEAALEAVRRLGHSTGWLLGNLGLAYADLGDAIKAITFYEQALVMSREIGDQLGEGTDLGNLGLAYAALGDSRKAITYHKQHLTVARKIGDRRGEGNALGNLGLAYAALGDERKAITFYEQWLEIAREIGDRRGESNALGNLGLAYNDLGYARKAITYHEQALVVSREIGDRRGEGADLGNLGLAYAALGDARKAISFYEQALVVSCEIGDRYGEGNAFGNLGLAYADLGDARKAITYHEQHLTVAREIGDRRGEGNALGNLGLAYAALGDARKAITYHEQALVMSREIGNRHGEGNALGTLGLAYAALGDTRKAITYYEQWLEIAREVGDRHGEAFSSWHLGKALVSVDQPEDALPFLETCVAYEREIGHPNAEPDAAIVEYVRQHGRWPDGQADNGDDEASHPR